MRQVTSKTEFESVTFGFTNQISIVSSYDTLTDTAEVIIPRKIQFKDKNGNNIENIASGENAVFKRGDTVKISMGYDHKLTSRFNGFIAGVRTKYPLEFSLEDDTYFLKQNSFTFALSNPTLAELVKKIMPESIKYVIHGTRNLGDFRISRASTAAVLNELRKKHGVYSWFRDGTLNIGLAVVPSLQKTIRFTMFKDIITADSLQFINDFDRKIKIIAESIKDDNTRLTATAGDQDGDTRKITIFNAQNIEDLQKIADAKVEQYKYSGYEGSFKVFGDKNVNHGDLIEIVNPQIPEQSGAYLCDKVVTTCGMDGLKQVISIKQKIYDING